MKNLRETQNIIYGVFLALCWLTVSARVYVRSIILKGLRWDDWFMLASLLSFTALIIMAIMCAEAGFGQHQADLSLESLGRVLKLTYWEEITYLVCIVPLKLSIIILLLRLVANQTGRYVVIGTATAITAFGVGIAFFLAFSCSPVAARWDLSVKGKCISLYTRQCVYYAYGAADLLTDAFYSILPIFLVWNIQLSYRTKFSVCLILGLGTGTIGVGIARFSFIHNASIAADPSFNYFLLGLTSILELCMGILASSLITLRPLIRLISERLSEISTNSVKWRKASKSSSGTGTGTGTGTATMTANSIAPTLHAATSPEMMELDTAYFADLCAQTPPTIHDDIEAQIGTYSSTYVSTVKT